MNIVICDDDIIQRRIIKNLIEENITNGSNINIVNVSSGEELLQATSKGAFDVIFLDIEMTGINGLETAKKIRKLDEQVIIVFITGYKDYAPNAFEVSAFRYIIKPIEAEKFKQCFNKIIEMLHKDNKDNLFEIKMGKQDLYIDKSDIVYFEKSKNKVIINTVHDQVEFYGTLNQVSKRINSDKFIQIHQGYIVNVDKIKILKQNEVLVEKGMNLPISRRKVNDVKRIFFQNMRRLT